MRFSSDSSSSVTVKGFACCYVTLWICVKENSSIKFCSAPSIAPLHLYGNNSALFHLAKEIRASFVREHTIKPPPRNRRLGRAGSFTLLIVTKDFIEINDVYSALRCFPCRCAPKPACSFITSEINGPPPSLWIPYMRVSPICRRKIGSITARTPNKYASNAWLGSKVLLRIHIPPLPPGKTETKSPDAAVQTGSRLRQCLGEKEK